MAEDEDVTPECYWTTTINTALIFWSDTVIPTNQARNLTKGHFCWRVHYNRVFSFTLSSIALQVSSRNITLSIDQKTHKPRQPLVILSFSDEKKKTRSVSCAWPVCGDRCPHHMCVALSGSTLAPQPWSKGKNKNRWGKECDDTQGQQLI